MCLRPTISSARYASALAIVLAATGCAIAAPARPNLPQVEDLVVEGTNRFRESQSLTVLRTNAELEKAARAFAEYMARTGEFEHDAGGTTPASRATAAGYDYCHIAENIARHYATAGFTTPDLAHRLVEGWKNSPGHRKNMLEPEVIETGVGIAHRRHDGYEDFYSVQLFGRPKSQSVRFQVRNNGRSTVKYRLGERQYELRPRYSRTHTNCGPLPLNFEAPHPASFTPAREECFVISPREEITHARGGCA